MGRKKKLGLVRPETQNVFNLVTGYNFNTSKPINPTQATRNPNNPTENTHRWLWSGRITFKFQFLMTQPNTKGKELDSNSNSNFFTDSNFIEKHSTNQTSREKEVDILVVMGKV